MTQQQTHNKKSEVYEVACQMHTTIKTHMKEVMNADTKSVDADIGDPQNNYVTGQRGTTDNAKMLADSTCQKGMYKTYQEEDDDEAYPEKSAAPRTITNDGSQNNGVPSQTGTKDIARRPAVPDVAPEKGEPNMQEIPCQVNVKDKTYTHIIDVPGAVANDNFDTNSPEDVQTTDMASMMEMMKRIAMTAFTSEERRAGGHN
jgi:hypothetical protein